MPAKTLCLKKKKSCKNPTKTLRSQDRSCKTVCRNLTFKREKLQNHLQKSCSEDKCYKTASWNLIQKTCCKTAYRNLCSEDRHRKTAYRNLCSEDRCCKTACRNLCSEDWHCKTAYRNLCSEDRRYKTAYGNLCSDDRHCKTTYRNLCSEDRCCKTAHRNLHSGNRRCKTTYGNLWSDDRHCKTTYRNLCSEDRRCKTTYRNLCLEDRCCQTAPRNLCSEDRYCNTTYLSAWARYINQSSNSNWHRIHVHCDISHSFCSLHLETYLDLNLQKFTNQQSNFLCTGKCSRLQCKWDLFSIYEKYRQS